MTQRFDRRTRIHAPAQTVFDWHKRPGALERLIPPWQRAEVLERRGGIRDGDRVKVRTWTAGIPSTWLIEHRDYIEGRQFRDLQLKGPFARWEHTHRFEPVDDGSCLVIDEIEYELPLGGLGEAMGESMVRDRLERMFDYRHRVLAEDLAKQAQAAGGRTMTVAISGAAGLIGSALRPLLTTGGHRVKRIVRGDEKGDDQVAWSPRQQTLNTARLAEVDAVIHLAGESLFGLWTDARKQRIRDSRAVGTQGIARALASMDRKPGVFICASAIGYYGSRGDELLTEDSPRGEGFLADVCEQWEQATRPAAEAGIRVVNLRFGVVLSPRGGALGLMLPVFRMGLGGRIGNGAGWVSWISIEDVIGIIEFAMLREAMRGPVNAAAPNPVRSGDFARTLARVLNRPAALSPPAPLVRWTLGELADEMLLASLRVSPLRLAQAGYPFRHTELEPALRALLGSRKA